MLSNFSLRQKQILSVIFTFLVYTWLVNWKVAILLIIGVGFHEYCHLLAAKKMKLSTGGFFILPFMGGVAFVTERYKSYSQQSFVALAGPIGGGLLAAVTGLLWYLTKIPFLGQAAQWMAFMNLFNLLPLSFLDGGQILNTVTFSINEKFGVVCKVISTIVAIFVIFKLNPLIAGLVLVFGTAECWAEIKAWKAKEEGDDHLVPDHILNRPRPMSLSKLWITNTVYFGTVLGLMKLTVWISSAGFLLENLGK